MKALTIKPNSPSETETNRNKPIFQIHKIVNNLDTNNYNKVYNQQLNKNNIFISYSHKDKEWLDTLNPYIKGMQIEGLKLDYWDDRKIKTGQNWKEEISKALDNASIAILLISQDFLASDFIQNNELPVILENAKKKGIRVLPVILSPCRFLKTSILKDFQSLNKPEIPLNTMEKHEVQAALLRLTYDIEESIG